MPGERIPVQAVGATHDPITTMGGLSVTPQRLVEDITAQNTAVLLLPGADTWSEPQHTPLLEKARELLNAGIVVGAICGATIARAQAGLRDHRPHTSNSLDLLKETCPNYHGAAWYQEVPAVADDILITANSAGGLRFAR